MRSKIECWLTLLDQPATSEAILVTTFEEIDWSYEVFVVIHFRVPRKDVVRSDLHLVHVPWRMEWSVPWVFNSWIILVRPWATIWITILVVFTTQEIDAFFFVFEDLYTKGKERYIRKSNLKSLTKRLISFNLDIFFGIFVFDESTDGS